MIFCVLSSIQCLNSLLSSKVSDSASRVVVGSMSLLSVPPSKYVHLPPIAISSSWCLCLSFSAQCTVAVPPACSAPFDKCERNAQSPIGLSSQHCLNPLAISPMKSSSYLIIVCCLNAILEVLGDLVIFQ